MHCSGQYLDRERQHFYVHLKCKESNNKALAYPHYSINPRMNAMPHFFGRFARLSLESVKKAAQAFRSFSQSGEK